MQNQDIGSPFDSKNITKNKKALFAFIAFMNMVIIVAYTPSDFTEVPPSVRMGKIFFDTLTIGMELCVFAIASCKVCNPEKRIDNASCISSNKYPSLQWSTVILGPNVFATTFFSVFFGKENLSSFAPLVAGIISAIFLFLSLMIICCRNSKCWQIKSDDQKPLLSALN